MFGSIKKNPTAFALALLAHVVILGWLLFSIDWHDKPDHGGAKEKIVSATLVDSKVLDAEKKRKQAEEQARKDAIKKKQLAAQQKKRAEQKRKQEARRKAEAKKQAEAKKRAEKKRAEEAARKAKLKKQQQAKARKEAELKKQAEKKRKQQEKIAAEKKRQQQAAKKKAEAQRKADEKRRKQKAEQEAALRAQMASEREQSEIGRHVAVIASQVERAWLRPLGTPAGLHCTVKIRMIPGGEVVSAQVVQSSGNIPFDRSAEAAVLKASPLSVPKGPLFEKFRQINFNFSPDQ
ncbi:MAG: cell envelope integrity protein TolA [gamma proteobacterium symbiont of Bathyaustriella thionipta]|nr:cell envelope integrity protein TolA [gamma proteobacterium symbiont of Bathyaustriella thionipta]